MCSQSHLEQILQAVYEKAVAKFGTLLDNVILYGSYARGDYDEQSDIDIMIKVRLTAKELKMYEWDFAVFSSRLSLMYDVMVSICLQDAETFEQYQNILPFFGNVAREGMIIGA
ncbi:nucleotidyltransferase domain-containing protein [bacterium 1XD42-1]|nr:nucleotidyltransferase domain-containing protein [bacterium 1XD42-8]RKJ67259.1 nucleotidyltransferase domain-containing protein [bacterium 1XD42-1]